MATVQNRGHDLEKTLQENNCIRERLQKQLHEAELREPDHPIIADPPVLESPDGVTTMPSPTPDTPHTPRTQRTPDSDDMQVGHSHREQFYTPRTDYDRYVQGQAPHSPASIDNSDLILQRGPAMPSYDRPVSFEEQENYQPTISSNPFSCGVGFSLGDDGEEEPSIHRPRPSSAHANMYRTNGATGGGMGSTASWSRRTTNRETDLSPSLTPSFTSSFDGVDFRTGLSGHRGLSHARKLHNSPKPRTQIRMMGEHRGLGHFRIPQRSPGGNSHSSQTNSPQPSTLDVGRPHSAVQALGPRFSLPGTDR
jgi:hypothetical protein